MIIGVVKGDTRSLDNGAHVLKVLRIALPTRV